MTDLAMHDNFSGLALHPALRWQSEPAHWRIGTGGGGLSIEPDAGTDFWQRTHYGFEVDNGHFLYLNATGDFTLTTQVHFSPRHQYDQAGLMVRLSPSCWLKTSVEFEPDGPSRLGAVVTNGQYSDWSTQPVGDEVTALWFRIRTERSDCIVESSTDGVAWSQLRIAHLSERAAAPFVQCGLYACSPKAAGFKANFAFLDFEPEGI